MKREVERVISEFTEIIDSKYQIIDNLIERKETELDKLRGLLKEKLKDFEKSMTEIGDTSQDISIVKPYDQAPHPEPDTEK